MWHRIMVIRNQGLGVGLVKEIHFEMEISIMKKISHLLDGEILKPSCNGIGIVHHLPGIMSQILKFYLTLGVSALNAPVNKPIINTNSVIGTISGHIGVAAYSEFDKLWDYLHSVHQMTYQ